MSDLKEFTDDYIKQLSIDEQTEFRERVKSEARYDPDDFSPITTKYTAYMMEIANRIANDLKDLEPSHLIFYGDKIAIGFYNPIPSTRISGEKYKSIIRVTIERNPKM